MAFEVIVPAALVHDESGRAHLRYRGEVVEWLGDEERERFLAEGFVTEAGSADEADESGDEGNESLGEGDESLGEGDSEPKRPPQTAHKDAWVDYAVATGKYTCEEAEAMSKADLIAALS